ATQHTLGPLAAPDAAHLLQTLLPDGEHTASAARVLRERVVQRTGGVPFFLVSCAQGLRAHAGESDTEQLVPWDVAHGIRQRVAALPEAVQQVLGVAAVVGRRVPHALLRQVTAHTEEEVLT